MTTHSAGVHEAGHVDAGLVGAYYVLALECVEHAVGVTRRMAHV